MTMLMPISVTHPLARIARRVALARGVSSPGAYLQMVGRPIRAAPGKTRATIIDLGGSVYNSKIGLPDSDRIYSLSGIAIREAGEQIS